MKILQITKKQTTIEDKRLITQEVRLKTTHSTEAIFHLQIGGYGPDSGIFSERKLRGRHGFDWMLKA
ncbi:hypothetical protein [Oceaniferula marina]|uniref:hypothetical protein n=1 Tax=Oceaniferula marina TaxID=2748318 RepID=UPI001D048ED3|nr:hypothetical protein [Oceaniferula marina]